MSWHILKCRAGEEELAEERVKDYFKFDTFLITGLRARCPRKFKQVTLEIYCPFPGYLFVCINDWRTYRHEHFAAQTRTRGFVRDSADQIATVSDRTMQQLFERVANREFDNWLSRALRFFEDKIGTQIAIPNGSLAGFPATVTAIEGDCLLCEVELLGKVIKTRAQIKKLWPHDSEAMMQLHTLKLADDLHITGPNPDFEPPPADPMPAPEPFAVEARPAPFRHRQPPVATPEDALPVSFATMPAPEVAPTLRTPQARPAAGAPRLIPSDPLPQSAA